MFSGGDIAVDKCGSLNSDAAKAQCAKAVQRLSDAVTKVCEDNMSDSQVASLPYCGDTEQIPNTFGGLHPKVQKGLKEILPERDFLQEFGANTPEKAVAMYDNIMAGKGAVLKAKGKKAPAPKAADEGNGEAGVPSDAAAKLGSGPRLRLGLNVGKGLWSNDGASTSSNNPYGDIKSPTSQERVSVEIGGGYGWKIGSHVLLNLVGMLEVFIPEEEKDPYGNKQRPNTILKPYGVLELQYIFGDNTALKTKFAVGAAIHAGWVRSLKKDILVTPGWATQLSYPFLGFGPVASVIIPTNDSGSAVVIGFKFMYNPSFWPGFGSNKDSMFGNDFVTNTYESGVNKYVGKLFVEYVF